MGSRTGRLDAVSLRGGRFLLPFSIHLFIHLVIRDPERNRHMAMSPLKYYSSAGKQQTLTEEQAIGQLLQHIDALIQRVTQLEQQVRQLAQARPTGKCKRWCSECARHREWLDMLWCRLPDRLLFKCRAHPRRHRRVPGT